MFQIGDNIVYPMHGAGVIEGIEEKEIQGQKRHYFVIKMPMENMQVMIQMDKVLISGIRSVSDIHTLKEVLNMFHQEDIDQSLSWKQRYQLNLVKLKTGNIKDGAEVIRDLTQINKTKSLNPSEKQLLDNAKKILISEISLIKSLNENFPFDLLDLTINQFELSS